MSEEEIIKRINFLIMRLIEERKEGKLDIGDIKLQEAIQGLLDLYKKQQKEIEERETRLQEEINENCKLKTELYGNSISKDKIKAKIKELEDDKYEHLLARENIIKTLQELLGE
jgi:hypothetical protein